jgi:uncharacterized membrane protein
MLAIYLLIVAAALVGLTITINIYKKKHTKKPLVCPFNADCDSVITSDFSSFMGIGLEIYGMFYYGFMTIFYTTMIFFPSLQNDYLMFFMSGLTIAAFLFSAYLTFLQAFVLRIWCSWCLMSAGISTAIFIFSMVGVYISEFSFIPILIEYKSYVTLLHLVGFALGVGGATISDVLFMKFLKDFKITLEEKEVLKIMSQIVWFGLMIIIISGVGLFLPEIERLLDSSKFLLKMVVIGVIIVNGLILNFIVTPKLMTIAWNPAAMNVKKAITLSNFAFATGAISFISWYTALFLGFSDSLPYTFEQLVLVYVGILIVGIIGSQIFRKFYIYTNSQKTNSTIAH